MKHDLAFGDVWMVQYEPVVGHGQGGKRPSVLLSRGDFNRGPARLVIAVPITSKDKGIEFRTPIEPPEGGVSQRSFAMPEMIRSVSRERLLFPMGVLREDTLRKIALEVRNLLNLDRVGER